MDKEKLNLLLDRLLEKTKAGELEWQTTISKSTFLVALKDTAISVTKISDDRYNFDFRNDMGDTVDSVIISETDLSDNPFVESGWGKARQIFALAHNQALKPEQTVDRILEQLAA
ncbi:MAG: hypothetical protein ACR2HG_14505 [Pyrinomonadaceae bacterium]